MTNKRRKHQRSTRPNPAPRSNPTGASADGKPVDPASKRADGTGSDTALPGDGPAKGKAYTAPKGRPTPGRAPVLPTAPSTGSATTLHRRDVARMNARKRTFAVIGLMSVASMLAVDMLAAGVDPPLPPEPVPASLTPVPPSTEEWSTVVSVYIPEDGELPEGEVPTISIPPIETPDGEVPAPVSASTIPAPEAGQDVPTSSPPDVAPVSEAPVGGTEERRAGG